LEAITGFQVRVGGGGEMTLTFSVENEEALYEYGGIEAIDDRSWNLWRTPAEEVRTQKLAMRVRLTYQCRKDPTYGDLDPFKLKFNTLGVSVNLPTQLTLIEPRAM
jgi:hypothetical protein